MSYVSIIIVKSIKAIVFVRDIALIGFDYPRKPEHENKWASDNNNNKDNYDIFILPFHSFTL